MQFLNAEEFVQRARLKHPDLTDTQESFIYGLFFGFGYCSDQTHLSEIVCDKLIEGYESLKEFLNEDPDPKPYLKVIQ